MGLLNLMVWISAGILLWESKFILFPIKDGPGTVRPGTVRPGTVKPEFYFHQIEVI